MIVLVDMVFKSDAQRKAVFSRLSNIDNRFSYAPVYVAADIPAMGVDAVGTAGATAVAAVPLLTTLGIGYIGADMVLKTKDRLKRQYDSEKRRKHASKSLISLWGEK